MPAKSGLETRIRAILKKHRESCRETKNFLAKNRLAVPVLADMLQFIPCESQKDLLNRYGLHITQVEKKLFNEIAGKWFTDGSACIVHGNYRLIDDLKDMLAEWGFRAFYEKHKKRMSFNINDELIKKLNVYYCLDELFESQLNKTHKQPVTRKLQGTRIASDDIRDRKLAMIAETTKTFFIAAILNIQLRWMLALMELAYLDGSMRASLDSEEYMNFDKMHQNVGLSSIDELMDMLELFPPHTSGESITALRSILNNIDHEIMQTIGKEKKRLLSKR